MIRRLLASLGRVPVKLGALSAAVLLVVGCATTATQAARGASSTPPPVIQASLQNIGIASPHTLLEAEKALGGSTSGYSSYGLELSYVVYKMIQILYPLYLQPEYVMYPPAGSIFPELFQQVESGKFAAVDQSQVSFLTLIIPPMAVLYSNDRGVLESSLEVLDHAEALNPGSVLPPYLKGVIAEKQGHGAVAMTEFKRALQVDSSCYPAAIGEAKILITERRYSEAENILQNLIDTIPPDAEVYRLDAEAQFALGYSNAAEKRLTRALELAPNEPAALLLGARIYESQKRYARALDELAKLDKETSPTPQTQLLRAQIEQEAGNMTAALEVLGTALKTFPGNREVSEAYGKALVAAGQTAEGSRYLAENPGQAKSGADSLELLVSSAIQSENWSKAATYVSRLLELRSDEKALNQAYEIYKALGDQAKVLEYARKLHATSPANTGYLIDYADSLAASGRKAEARKALDAGIAAGGPPEALSRLYYERSRLAQTQSTELEDLRSALLENLENEKALTAIARYYLRIGDLSSARSYAAEAQAFLPSGEKLPEDLAKIIAPNG